MSVLNIIVGILLVIGGFSCMFTPFATFLSAGYYRRYTKTADGYPKTK